MDAMTSEIQRLTLDNQRLQELLARVMSHNGYVDGYCDGVKETITIIENSVTVGNLMQMFRNNITRSALGLIQDIRQRAYAPQEIQDPDRPF
jgi:hypothetical protein